MEIEEVCEFTSFLASLPILGCHGSTDDATLPKTSLCCVLLVQVMSKCASGRGSGNGFPSKNTDILQAVSDMKRNCSNKLEQVNKVIYLIILDSTYSLFLS